MQCDEGITARLTADVQSAGKFAPLDRHRLETMLNSIDAIIYVADMNTHEILFVNHALREIWGDLRGQKCWKAIQDGQAGPCVFCTNHKLLDEHGNPTGIIKWEFRNSKTRRWYACQDSAIPWVDGRIVRMECAVDITEQKQTVKALQERDDFLEAITLLATRFINVPLEQIDSALNEMICKLGAFAEVDRAYIFKNDNDRRESSNTHEWCAEGITPQIDALQSVSFDHFPDVVKLLQTGAPYHVPRVPDLDWDNPTRRILDRQNIQSILLLPLMRNRIFTGFVGFDMVRTNRCFEDTELYLLRIAVEIIANIMERQRTEEKKRRSLRRHQFLANISRKCVNVQDGELDAVINEALSSVGQMTHSDSCFLYFREQLPESLPMIYEWCAEGVDSRLNGLRKFSYSSIKWAMDHLHRFEHIHLPRVADGTAEGKCFKEFLLAQGIQSACAVPLWKQGRLQGLLGFSSIFRERGWSEADRQLLAILADTLANLFNRMRTEADLRIKDQAIAASMDAMALTDLSGRMVYVNPAYLELWGYERADQVLGRPAADFWQDGNQLVDFFHLALEQGGAQGEFVACRKDRKLMDVRLSATLIRDDHGRPTSIVASFRDITERLKKERELVQAKRQAEAATLAKSEFLANMSHEIRTPMNGVIGMTGLLLDTALSAEQRRYAENISSSGEALMSLINDILDFSKIEAGRLDLEMLDFDLHHLLDDFAATMAVRAHEKRLELICHADPDVPGLLRGDPSRLRQILVNLVGNAVKFTSAGEVELRVQRADGKKPGTQESHPRQSEDIVLLFTVRDTGIGIPEDKIDYIFDKFSQVDATTTRRFGGTGLGLAICRQLAGLMGGEIGVSSNLGQGSEFWFTAAFTLQSVQDRVAHASLPVLEGRHVLVVDDNALNREILARQLRSWGARSVEMENGPSALAALDAAHAQNDAFELVILDMQMPGMDGASLGRTLKSTTRHRDIPLIMLTSLGRPGDARRFQSIGFAAYLNKPIRKAELHDTLITVLQVAGRTPGEQSIVTRHLAREMLRRKIVPRFSGHVLVVEDNPVNQQVAIGILHKFGLSTEVAMNGAEALHAVERTSYDLVLMDVQMPGMDGLEATRQIRRREGAHPQNPGDSEDSGRPGGARCSRLPVIAMTAGAMQQDRERCRAAGMDDYLAKPVNPVELAKTLAKWLPSGQTAAQGLQEADAVQKTEGGPWATELPAFDKTELLRRCMGDRQLVRYVVLMFQDGLAARVTTLAEHVRKEDPALRQLAHSLKGSALNAACPALAKAAEDLEAACRESNVIDPQLLHTVEQETQRTLRILKKEIQSPDSI